MVGVRFPPHRRGSCGVLNHLPWWIAPRWPWRTWLSPCSKWTLSCVLTAPMSSCSMLTPCTKGFHSLDLWEVADVPASPLLFQGRFRLSSINVTRKQHFPGSTEELCRNPRMGMDYFKLRWEKLWTVWGKPGLVKLVYYHQLPFLRRNSQRAGKEERGERIKFECVADAGGGTGGPALSTTKMQLCSLTGRWQSKGGATWATAFFLSESIW